jgi:hypothetical protein
MKTDKTILPTIHLNGTSAASLTEDYAQARRAVQDAMNAMQKIDFNNRDYYPQGQMAWLDAVRQRQNLFNALAHVAAELHKIEAHCFSFIK